MGLKQFLIDSKNQTQDALNRSAQLWEDYKSRAEVHLLSILDDDEFEACQNDKDYRNYLVEVVAEVFAIKECFVPPHYTRLIDCPNCGTALAAADYLPGSLRETQCQWCAHDVFKASRELSKELELTEIANPPIDLTDYSDVEDIPL
jgi:hypothetical protein